MDDKFKGSCALPTTLLVPGVTPDCPLLTRWCGVQRITLYAREGMGKGAGLCQVSWDTALWNSTTRRLVNQAHGYFLALHQQSQGGGGGGEGGVSPSSLLLHSRYYRSALRECVLGLREEDQRRRAAGLSPQYREQAEVHSTMELVWHLCEILFIEVLPAGCLIQQLCEWVCWHEDEGEGRRLELVLLHTPPETHRHFWPLLYRLVLSGRFTQARKLLSQHSAALTMETLFSRFDELLRKAPMVHAVASLSRAELQHRWQEWKREATTRTEAGDFVAVPQLQLLARVLCGEQDMFKHPDVVGSCHSWYELMVARLLFTSPLLISADYELVFIAEESLQVVSHAPSSRDRLLLAALRHSALEVVSVSASELSSWWLAAHLSDLLYRKGELGTEPEYGSRLSEFLLVEYATSLLTHQSLWQVAMDYFSMCPTQGRHHMSLHIVRVPLTSERKALKVLYLCQQYQLHDEARSVCRVLAMREFRAGRLGVAMSWCLKARDATFAAFLAEKYFDSYQSLGEFVDLDLLDHLGSAMLLSEKLTFLGKYRQFHQLYQQQSFVEAGQLLVSLLRSNVVPKRYWLTLLTDALPLLDLPDQVVFNSENTTTLAHCLQQLTCTRKTTQPHSSSKSHDSLKRSHDPPVANGDKLSLLQLALCRNLARAGLEDEEEEYAS